MSSAPNMQYSAPVYQTSQPAQDNKSAIQRTCDNDPSIQQGNDAKPAVHQTDDDKPALQRVDDDKPAVQQADGDKPAVQQADGDKPAVQQADGDKPAVQQADGDKPAVQQADGDKPAVQQADGDKPAVQQADGDKPAQADGDKPALQQADGDKPALQQADDDKPAVQHANEHQAAVQDANEDMPAVEHGNEDKPDVRSANQDKPAVQQAEHDNPAIQQLHDDKPIVRPHTIESRTPAPAAPTASLHANATIRANPQPLELVEERNTSAPPMPDNGENPQPSAATEAVNDSGTPPPPLVAMDPSATREMVKAGDKFGAFVLVNIIGKGSSGYVWKVRHQQTKQFAAVKVLSNSTDGPCIRRSRLLSHMVNELAPEALQYLCVAEETGKIKNQDCIVTRIYSTDLCQLIDTERLFPLPKDHSTAIIWQILKGLHYLHSLNIVHGDIKPANILLKDGGTMISRQLGPNGQFKNYEILKSAEVIICDLEDVKLPRRNAYQPAGTPSYRAPEVVECLDWNSKADVFSLGCVAYELLTRRLLFPEQRLGLRPMGIEPEPIEILSPAAKWAFVANPEALNFIQQAVNRLPNQRPIAKTLLKHGFFGR
ncbi:hypothetical protein CVT26_012918, partial [Gymnopilus dilepis]